MITNKQFVLEWNNTFPLDYWWRKKYNIPFNSKKHREVSYIDIYYEWLEEHLYEEHVKSVGEETERLRKYKETGEWITPYVDKEQQEEEDKLFDMVDIVSLNTE